VRGAVLLWVSGAAVAFLATAGAFLLLASLATRPEPPGPDASRIPNPGATSRATGGVFVEIDEGSLAGLRAAPDQQLAVNVRNTGDAELSRVRVDLAVFPAGSPAGTPPRTYREEVGEVLPGRPMEVGFDVDLSPPEANGARTGEERPYLEVRASSEAGSGNDSGSVDVKTVVLAPRGG
jgi:hypothetical protein